MPLLLYEVVRRGIDREGDTIYLVAAQNPEEAAELIDNLYLPRLQQVRPNKLWADVVQFIGIAADGVRERRCLRGPYFEDERAIGVIGPAWRRYDRGGPWELIGGPA